MHIHGNSISVNAASLYSPAQGETSAAAQRAAEVRKKLQKSAAGLEIGATPEETLLIGQWLDGRHSQVLSEDQCYTTAAGKNPDLG
jgi:hypothetical protein